MREAVLRYSREIAFAAAEVYAQAAEARGAWDARLEALVVDALLRGEADDSLRSRAAALGWGALRVGGRGAWARRLTPRRRWSVDEIRRVARAEPPRRAHRRPGRPAGRGPRRRQRPGPRDPAPGGAVRPRPGRRRAGGGRPARRRPQRRGRGGRAAGRAGLARGAAAGARRRPAARAGARRRPDRPPDPGRRGLPAAAGVRLGAARHPRRLPRADRLAGGDARGSCSCTPTPSATGCGGSPRSSAMCPATPGTRSPCGSRWPSAGSPTAQPVL